MNHTTPIYHGRFQFPQTSIDFFLMAVIQNYRPRDLKSLVLYVFFFYEPLSKKMPHFLTRLEKTSTSQPCMYNACSPDSSTKCLNIKWMQRCCDKLGEGPSSVSSPLPCPKERRFSTLFSPLGSEDNGEQGSIAMLFTPSEDNRKLHKHIFFSGQNEIIHSYNEFLFFSFPVFYILENNSAWAGYFVSELPVSMIVSCTLRTCSVWVSRTKKWMVNHAVTS